MHLINKLMTPRLKVPKQVKVTGWVDFSTGKLNTKSIPKKRMKEVFCDLIIKPRFDKLGRPKTRLNNQSKFI